MSYRRIHIPADDEWIDIPGVGRMRAGSGQGVPCPADPYAPEGATPMTAAERAPKGTVYLIAQPTVKANGRQPNLVPLAEHGPILTVVAAGEYPSRHPERALRLITNRLADFNPETDALVWAGGDTLAAFLTGAVLRERGIREVTWLRYDRGRDPLNPKIRTDENATYVRVRVPLVDDEYLAAVPDTPHDEEHDDDDD